MPEETANPVLDLPKESLGSANAEVSQSPTPQTSNNENEQGKKHPFEKLLQAGDTQEFSEWVRSFDTITAQDVEEMEGEDFVYFLDNILDSELYTDYFDEGANRIEIERAAGNIERVFPGIVARYEGLLRDPDVDPGYVSETSYNVANSIHFLLENGKKVNASSIENLIRLMSDLDELVRDQSALILPSILEYGEATGDDSILVRMKESLKRGLLSGSLDGDEMSSFEYGLSSFSRQDYLDTYRGALLEMDDAQQSSDLTHFANKIGLVAAETYFSGQINDLQVNPEEKEKLAKLLKRMTPKEVVELQTDLAKLYEKINFEDYPLNNRELTNFELTLIRANVPNKEARILDIGTGTGRLLLGLREIGFGRVVGFDLTDRHVQYIKDKEPDAQVMVGSWFNMPFKQGSVRFAKGNERLFDTQEAPFDAAVMLGRNVSHNLTPGDVGSFFAEAASVVKKGGLLFVDIPDRSKGSYKDEADFYSQKMLKRGFRSFEYGLIFDSPDGEHYFTRFAPDEEQLTMAAARSGFKKVDRVVREIPDGKGNENIYLVFTRDNRAKEWAQVEELKKLGFSAPAGETDWFRGGAR